MAEYIERESALYEAEKYGCSKGCVSGRHSGIADIIADNIFKIPAADVRPERHSHWHEYESCVFMGRFDKDGEPIFQDRKTFMCVKCGRNTIIKETFCPNCGAKMDGKR